MAGAKEASISADVWPQKTQTAITAAACSKSERQTQRESKQHSDTVHTHTDAMMALWPLCRDVCVCVYVREASGRSDSSADLLVKRSRQTNTQQTDRQHTTHWWHTQIMWGASFFFFLGGESRLIYMLQLQAPWRCQFASVPGETTTLNAADRTDVAGITWPE